VSLILSRHLAQTTAMRTLSFSLLQHFPIFLFLFISFSGFSQTPGIVWSKSFGGITNEAGRNILTADSGQTFLIVGDTTRNSNNLLGDSADIWVMKLNKDGERIWSKTFGGSGNDRIRKTYLHSDGSFTIIAYSNSNDGDVSGNHGGGDIWVAKISGDGIVIWQRCLGGSLAEDYRNDELLADNSLIIAGFTTSNDGDVTGHHANNDFWIVKLTNSGSLEWQKCLGGNNDDRPRSVISMADGSFIITGFSNSTNGDISGNLGNTDVWVVKLSSSGNLIWKRLYGGILDETGYKAIIANNGNIIVLSETTSTNGNVSGNHGSRDAWILSIDPANGSIVWQRCIGGSGVENVRNMVKDLDGNFIVVSYTASNDGDATGSNGKQVLFNKINESGSLLLSKCFGGATSTDLFSYISTISGLVNTYRTNLFVDPTDNSYLLVATVSSDGGDVNGYHYSRPSPNALADAWIVKIENNGNIRWQKSIGGSVTDNLVDVQKTGNEEFAFLGYSTSSNGDLENNNGGLDLWVLKLGPVSRIHTTQFVDQNLNGIKDIDEPWSDLTLQSGKSGNVKRKVPVNGETLFEVDTGMYVTKPILPNSYYNVDPSTDTSVFTNYFQNDSVVFRLLPVAGNRDINISIVPISVVRPGFSVSYELICRNSGTDTVPAGQVLFKSDSRINFLASVPPADAGNGDTLKWNYSDFKPFDTIRIYIDMQVQPPPFVNIGDTVNSIAFISPVEGDITPSDDTAFLRQRIQGSYDPNDKSENFEGNISQQQIINGAYINYLVRFQNTGTDTAFNITVRDTLDSKLDWSSLEIIEASHPYHVQLNEQNIITWNFTNIRLVDSTHNEPASHGFIAFRIKPQSYLNNGDIIENAASIYFDFNLPVKTNTTLTKVNGYDLKICPQSNTTISFSTTGGSFQWQVDDGQGYINISDNLNYQGCTNDTLQLVSVPAAWYGYKYRCIINDQNGTWYSPVYTIMFRVKWNGEVNTAWENAANWDCGNLPGISSDVVIDAGTVMLNSNTTIRSLVIRPGAKLIIKNGFTLTILH
jgi:uncharacterized repeat protein (TIGR01451 family)